VFAPLEEDFFQRAPQPDQLVAQLRSETKSLREEADRLRTESQQTKGLSVLPNLGIEIWIRLFTLMQIRLLLYFSVMSSRPCFSNYLLVTIITTSARFSSRS
jgi:hypothetical protein